MKAAQIAAPVEVLTKIVEAPSGILWILATTCGFALGMPLATIILSGVMRPAGPLLWGMLNVLIYGAIIGFSTGILQFLVLPRRLVPFRRWTLAVTAGGAVGFALAAVVAETIGNAFDLTDHVVLGQGLIAVIAGAIIGLAIGFGQQPVLQQRLPHLRGWIPASVTGTVLGTVLASGLIGLFEIKLFSEQSSISVGAMMGIATGLFQALVFWSYRKRLMNRGES